MTTNQIQQGTKSMNTISIVGLDKAELLAALFNASQQRGMGFIHTEGRSGMTVEGAREVLKSSGDYFDYLRGRVMKIDLSEEPMRTALYNRDNGSGAAERVVAELRAKTEAA